MKKTVSIKLQGTDTVGMKHVIHVKDNMDNFDWVDISVSFAGEKEETISFPKVFIDSLTKTLRQINQ